MQGKRVAFTCACGEVLRDTTYRADDENYLVLVGALMSGAGTVYISGAEEHQVHGHVQVTVEDATPPAEKSPVRRTFGDITPDPGDLVLSLERGRVVD